MEHNNGNAPGIDLTFTIPCRSMEHRAAVAQALNTMLPRLQEYEHGFVVVIRCVDAEQAEFLGRRLTERAPDWPMYLLTELVSPGASASMAQTAMESAHKALKAIDAGEEPPLPLRVVLHRVERGMSRDAGRPVLDLLGAVNSMLQATDTEQFGEALKGVAAAAKVCNGQ